MEPKVALQWQVLRQFAPELRAVRLTPCASDAESGNGRKWLPQREVHQGACTSSWQKLQSAPRPSYICE